MLTRCELIRDFDIPGQLATQLLDKLQKAGLLNQVKTSKEDEDAFQPAYDPDDFTVKDVARKLSDIGNSNFIPKANSRFASIFSAIEAMRSDKKQEISDISLLDLPDMDEDDPSNFDEAK